MDYTYHPQNVCPMEIRFRLEDDTVHDIRFVGGCNGNLKAISKLVDGWTVEKIESYLKGHLSPASEARAKRLENKRIFQ